MPESAIVAQQTVGLYSAVEREGVNKGSWAQIVAASRNQANTKLDFFAPLVVNGKQIVAPPEEVRLEGSAFW